MKYSKRVKKECEDFPNMLLPVDRYVVKGNCRGLEVNYQEACGWVQQFAMKNRNNSGEKNKCIFSATMLQSTKYF